MWAWSTFLPPLYRLYVYATLDKEKNQKIIKGVLHEIDKTEDCSIDINELIAALWRKQTNKRLPACCQPSYLENTTLNWVTSSWDSSLLQLMPMETRRQPLQRLLTWRILLSSYLSKLWLRVWDCRTVGLLCSLCVGLGAIGSKNKLRWRCGWMCSMTLWTTEGWRL